MLHSKTFLKNLQLPNEYRWYGFFEGFHHFCKDAPEGGFFDIRCKPEDIENGNIYDMAKYEVTY